MAPPAVVEAVSGAAAGCVALVATYPLMTVSTLQATRSKRLQAQLPSHKAEKKTAIGTLEDIAEVCAPDGAPLKICSSAKQLAIDDCSLRNVQIIRESGWQGLFQGLQASLLGTAVSQVSVVHAPPTSLSSASTQRVIAFPSLSASL